MATARKRKTSSHVFTLIVSGATELTDDLQDALFEAGCDDALVGVRDGVLFLDFDREAITLNDAVSSAVADVERADAGLRVARVEPDDLVTAAEIARRTGRSRQGVRQLVLGRRGPGGFPPPLSGLKQRSPIWRWTEVARWFAEKGDPAGSIHREAIE
ncbi:MAG TPA: hypothetical protein VGX76_10435, partial [Pirellulales bacterium]|nr:hypothetical protein [Pirellulales bacterium]